MSFRARYVAFLSQLEDIAERHQELTDTDVRERLREVVNYYFVWGKSTAATLPKRFAMLSAPADKRVASAVRKFIVDARALAKKEHVAPGSPRHALIEDSRAVTRKGSAYDLFVGSSGEPLPPSLPAADRLFKYTRVGKPATAISPLDLGLLAVELAGATITPTFTDMGFYRYVLPNGTAIGVVGKTSEEVLKRITTAIEKSLKINPL